MAARVFTLTLLVVGLLLAGCGGRAVSCQFAGGFATLHSAIPIDVGDCKDNITYAANGDGVQHTAKGVLEQGAERFVIQQRQRNLGAGNFWRAKGRFGRGPTRGASGA